MDRLVCPACLCNQVVYIYERIYDDNKLLKCRACGLYFISPKPCPEKNKKIYEKEYYNAWALNEIDLESAIKIKYATAEHLLNSITRYRKKGSILDVGCAFGHFLEVAQKKGWDTYGVELSEYSADKAKKKIGIDKIHCGSIDNLSFPNKKFDVITMVDVIEHIYDVSAVLKRCKELLESEGLLVIVTPDINSLSQKMMCQYWPHFNREHVIYFSRDNAGKILKINGFMLLETSSFKKIFNFCYIRSQLHKHGRPVIKFLIDIAWILTPSFFRKINFFMPHGEILVIAQRGE